MKTELIYSKNRREDLDRALAQLDAFRLQYRHEIETRSGFGINPVIRFRNRIRLRLQPGSYGTLAEADRRLEALCNELRAIRSLVDISNTLQETYEKYKGELDIRLKPKGKKNYILLISTGGYSDDIGGRGSVRIPSISREFTLSAEDADRIFRRGAVDFSWLDKNLNDIGSSAANLHPQIMFCLSTLHGKATARQELLPLHFEDAGNNPVQYLDQ